MVVEKLREILGRRKPVEVSLGPITITVKDRRHIPSLPLAKIDLNLRIAHENGVKPLSLQDILSQIQLTDIANTVFFDTPPAIPVAGNHWRVIRINPDTKSATLHFCGTYGSFDYNNVSPVEVPLTQPLFTGISIQEYKLDNAPATLSQVAQAVADAGNEYPRSNIKYLSERIFWSGSEGLLQTKDQHPAFRDRP